jgi:hypothetical protein
MALQHRGDHVRGQIVGAGLRECPAIPAEGRADRVDDEGVGDGPSLRGVQSCSVRAAAGTRAQVSTRALKTYLNDHLAGSTLGVELAQRLCERTDGTPLHEVLATIALEISEDREKVIELMERLDVSENPVKQAAAWAAEKLSRLKLGELGGIMGANDEFYDLFLSLESLSLGVEGKLRLWLALGRVAGDHEGLDALELKELADRARGQRDALERARLDAAASALSES